MALIVVIVLAFVSACAAEKFTVTFDSAGGSAVASVEVEKGSAVSEPEEPTYGGYEFDGWYLDGEKYDFSSPVNGNITLTAKWTKLFTVTFDSAGGSSVKSQTVREGERAVAPQQPTYGINVFEGWYLGNTLYNFSTPVTANITLVAHWTEKVTITFDAEEGSAVPQQTIEKGQSAQLPEQPDRSGYRFDCWLLEGQPYDFSTPVTTNITLTAKWVKVYTVTVDKADGSAPATYTVDEGEAVGQLAKPDRPGYSFEGWTVNGQAYDVNTPVNADITIVAAWKQLFTVTFDSAGGTDVAAQTVKDGEKATLPEEPHRAGYRFAGWNDASGAYNFDTPVTSNITLTAQWTEIEEMLVGLNIGTSSVKKEYVIGDAFTSDGITVNAVFRDKQSGSESSQEVLSDDPALTIDDSGFNSAQTGTYTIYVGYTFDDITRWASYEVTVTSVISGVHGIELSKTKVEYDVAVGTQPEVINIDDLTVNAVETDGTLGEVITEGITYKYFFEGNEIAPEEMTNANVRTFQIWAYVDYTAGSETYTMSDFVLVTVVGDEIYEMSLASGTTSQPQGYTQTMTADWKFSATYTLTGAHEIDLSAATVGTQPGQYTVTGINTAVAGGGTAIVTYYYALGEETVSFSCEVNYTITEATQAAQFGAIIDISAGTADQAELPAATHVITAVANGDTMVENMVVSNGISGVNSENKAGANGEGKLYGRVQFGTTKGLTLYMAGPATITLYARYGSSGGGSSYFVLQDTAYNVVAQSAEISNGSAYQIVTVEVPYAGVYTLFASSGSLNTFRIEIAGNIIPAQAIVNANDFAAEDIAEYTAEKALGDTFTIVAASGASVKIEDKSAEPATVGGIEFTKNINLGGSKKGSGNARSIKFTVTEEMLAGGKVYLTVYANHGGGAGTIRTLGAYADGQSGSGKFVYSMPVDGAGTVGTMVIDAAGTYYLGSAGSGIVLYKLVLSYQTAQGEV